MKKMIEKVQLKKIPLAKPNCDVNGCVQRAIMQVIYEDELKDFCLDHLEQFLTLHFGEKYSQLIAKLKAQKEYYKRRKWEIPKEMIKKEEEL